MSVDNMRERCQDPFRNLIIQNTNDLVNPETVKHYIQNSFDSKTKHLKIKLAHLEEKQKELEIFKEKHLEKIKDQDNEYSKEQRLKERIVKENIKRLKIKLEAESINPFRRKSQVGVVNQI